MAPKPRRRTPITSKRTLPRISQFLDMPLLTWQPRSCGIASLATLIGFHQEKAPLLKPLLRAARAQGAYTPTIGWRHKELAALASAHGLTGQNFDWSAETSAAAWKKFKQEITRGPVIASIYKDFKPGNGGHLIPVRRITGNLVFYNEPASRTRRGIARRVSIGRFRAGWKKRIITVAPPNSTPYFS